MNAGVGPIGEHLASARASFSDASRPLIDGLFVSLYFVGLALPIVDRSFVSPFAFCGVVAFLLVVVPAEDSGKVFGVGKSFLNDRRGIGVMQDVFLEVFFVRKDVIDDAAEESDVAAGADADEVVAHRRGPAEARIDV